MKPTTAELLSLLAERAPGLRAAGVTSFTVDGFTAQLTAHDPPLEQGAARDDDAGPTDAFDDPITFGRSRGVPGYRREESETE
ncbi:MAG: hypothetical protein H0V17_12580 [Deltaproteobacteria bacterium]|nr:hypothetical protein [Deltaproteobacteria bacterium]